MRKAAVSVWGLALLLSAVTFWACQTKEVTSAKVYMQENDYDKAIEQLQKAVAANPQNAEAYYLLGRAYGVKERYAEMADAFNSSLAISEKFATEIGQERDKYWFMTFNKGVELFNQQNIEEAKSAFEMAAVIKPDNTDAYRNAALCYERLGNYEKAVESMQKVIDLEPGNTEAHMQLGTIHYNNKEFEKAAAEFEKVLELDPANADAISNVGLVYDQMGQSDKALSAYEKAIANHPDNMDLVFNYAKLLYNMERYSEAIEKFKAILEKNPEDYDALYITGLCYINIADRARRQMRGLEEENNKSNDAKIAELKEKAKATYTACIPYFEKAVSLKEDNRDAWWNLGIAYTQAGDAKKGKEAFDKAEALDKN